MLLIFPQKFLALSTGGIKLISDPVINAIREVPKLLAVSDCRSFSDLKTLISNSNWTEWNTLQGVIARVIWS